MYGLREPGEEERERARCRQSTAAKKHKLYRTLFLTLFAVLTTHCRSCGRSVGWSMCKNILSIGLVCLLPERRWEKFRRDNITPTKKCIEINRVVTPFTASISVLFSNCFHFSAVISFCFPRFDSSKMLRRTNIQKYIYIYKRAHTQYMYTIP